MEHAEPGSDAEESQRYNRAAQERGEIHRRREQPGNARASWLDRIGRRRGKVSSRHESDGFFPMESGTLIVVRWKK